MGLLEETSLLSLPPTLAFRQSQVRMPGQPRQNQGGQGVDLATTLAVFLAERGPPGVGAPPRVVYVLAHASVAVVLEYLFADLVVDPLGALEGELLLAGAHVPSETVRRAGSR